MCFIKILSSSLNTMLIVDKHCSDVCCDELPVPQIDRKSRQVKEQWHGQFYLQSVRGKTRYINPFTADPVKALHFAILVNPAFLIFDIRALWRSRLSARAPECQKLKMLGYTSMALNPLNSGDLEQLALKGLKTENIKICRSITKLEATKMQLVCIFFHICCISAENLNFF